MSRLHVGVFGPGDSGKTTLLKQLSASYWKLAGIRSICLDPNLEKWGDHAFVTDDEEKFNRVFWSNKGCAVFIEEATETIARDRKKNGLFTRGRHQEHKIFVSGHSGSNLLPVQRGQLFTLFLFRQPESAAQVWSELFTDKRILECAQLQQYEFLHCQIYKPPVKCRLDPRTL